MFWTLIPAFLIIFYETAPCVVKVNHQNGKINTTLGTYPSIGFNKSFTRPGVKSKQKGLTYKVCKSSVLLRENRVNNENLKSLKSHKLEQGILQSVQDERQMPQMGNHLASCMKWETIKCLPSETPPRNMLRSNHSYKYMECKELNWVQALHLTPRQKK